MNGFLYLIELIFDVMHIAPNALIDGEEVGVIVFLVSLKLVRNGVDAPMVDVDFGDSNDILPSVQRFFSASVRYFVYFVFIAGEIRSDPLASGLWDMVSL